MWRPDRTWSCLPSTSSTPAWLARSPKVAYESGAHYVSVLYWDQHVTAGNATPILRDDVWVLE